MSSKVTFNTLTSGGVTYGRKQRSEDIERLQNFAHQYTQTFIADLLSKSSRSTTGFDFVMTADGGNLRQVTVGNGRVYGVDGTQYATDGTTVITFDAASVTTGQNRIDAIVAVVDDVVETDNAEIPVQRIRTQAELETAVAPYVPTQLSAYQTLENRATVMIKKGATSAMPVAPTVAGNEVLLYLVNVPGASVGIRTEDFTNARPDFRTQREQDEFIEQLRSDLEALILRVVRLEDIDTAPIDWDGQLRSLREILFSIQNQLNALGQVNPEILRPGLALADPANGKLEATGDVDNGVPCVDVELGSKIRFAAAEHFLTPSKFADQTRNPRLVQTDGGSASKSLETVMSLANVIEIDSDGQIAFNKKAAAFSTGRYRPASCSRGSGANQGQYIEIYGGTTVNDFSHVGLSTWHSYDVLNDVLTQRTLTGTEPPSADNPYLFPYDDGKVLCVAGKTATSVARWFRVNAVTGVSTEILTTRPTGNFFYGDKIADEKIFIIAQTLPVNSTPESRTFWVFDTSTETFTQVNPSGNVPLCPIDYAQGCFYREGFFVQVELDKLAPQQSGKTYVFELASLTWRELNIASPYQVEYGSFKSEYFNRAIPRFRMAHVAGRVFLAGGGMRRDSNIGDPNSLIWELKVDDYTSANPALQTGWDYFWANYPVLQDCGFCTTYTPVFQNNLRQAPLVDRAVMVAGQNVYGADLKDIYVTSLGGLVATTYNGQPGITLGDTATFAEIVLPVHVNDWDVAQYYIALFGKFEPGQIEILVSFDDDVTRHEVKPEEALTVTDSLSPGKRHLRILLKSYHYTTAQGSGGSRPILTKIREIFDQDGQLGSRTVLRFDVVTNEPVKAVYMDNKGEVSPSTTVAPSTATKCLLLKITTGVGAVAPAVKKYVNRRKARTRVTKTYNASDPTTKQFDNDLAVVPTWIKAYGIKASDNHVYDLVEPTINFDQTVTVNGVTDGDKLEVELEG